MWTCGYKKKLIGSKEYNSHENNPQYRPFSLTQRNKCRNNIDTSESEEEYYNTNMAMTLIAH